MAEYIKREALLDAIDKLPNITEWCFYEDDVVDMARDIPAADVVEVVRCKYCVNCLTDNTVRANHLCMRRQNVFPRKVDLMDFCSYGERRDGHAEFTASH